MSSSAYVPPVPPAGPWPPPNVWVGLKRDQVDPPTALYITRNDHILLRVHNSTPGLIVRTRLRLLLPEGNVIPMTFDATPTSARVLFETSFQLGEGFLLGLAVRGEAAAARRGACFVQVLLLRGGLQADQPVETLFSDYLAEGQLIGWPGGNIRQSLEGPGLMRNILGTAPAAGANITETVPTGARWMLQSFRFSLTTSLVVANRRVHVLFDDGANIFLDMAAADVVAAALTRNYNLDPAEFARTAQDSEIYVPFFPAVLLTAGQRIRTTVTGLDVGDQFTAPRYVVQEWIEP
jgi:hypothetical protein